MRPGIPRLRPHPLQAVLLAFPLVLFASVIPTDIAYLSTAEIQWSNFSAWLITGGLLTGVPSVLWSAADCARSNLRSRALATIALLAAMWVVGFLNILIHSRDAWYSVTATGLFLSMLTVVLALAAVWLTYWPQDRGGR